MQESREDGLPLRAEKLSEQVYRLMRDRIVDGRLPPGTRLSLESLLTELGVSKTPLREALARLEREHLVTTKPRSGTYVALPDLDDLAEVCELRRGIEWQATQLATNAIPTEELLALREEVERAAALAATGDYALYFSSDTRLHQTIFNYCGNRRLYQAHEAIDSYVRWLRVLGTTGAHRAAGSSRRHLELIDALLRRDADAASTIMAIHIAEVQRWTTEDFAAARIPTPTPDARIRL